MMIYKVFRAHEAAALDDAGQTAGAPIDIADGYIHFSTATQLAETLEKHFAQEEGLWLLAVESDRLGSDLEWEPSRGGQLFPHLYRDLTEDDIAWRVELDLGPEGHVLPGDVA